MGSALANVAIANNSVTLVGTPLDKNIIDCLKKGEHHPGLQVVLNQNIIAIQLEELCDTIMQSADVIILGVSSPGVKWALELIQRSNPSPNILALVTKGLVSGKNANSAPLTYAHTISAQMTDPAGQIVGIGGPCIARELALSYPTRVCFASHEKAVAKKLAELLKTDYYVIATHDDICGLEACAALKNFMCIGVSAMFTAYKLNGSHAKNPVAALFNQAVHETAVLSHWIKFSADNTAADQAAAKNGSLNIAFDLAGLGDLHVTVGGGRNSKLGQYVGAGRLLSDILKTDMHNVTVEGVDTGRQLLSGFRYACRVGTLNVQDLPLTNAILNVIENDQPFKFNFNHLPV